MSEIKNWYAGKNVLITGATGFVGKVLVEKLLRECDQVNCIYLIVRGKKNFKHRCDDYLNHLVFDNIRKAGKISKIRFFQGDLAAENIGLSAANLSEILDSIDIILHSGADVKFDLSLRNIFNTNTIGTYRLLEIAKQIKKLQVFVFVSTTYSQSNRKVTDEQHYDTLIDVFTIKKALNKFDDETMLALQPKILGVFPNTYSLSKHLTEDLVYRYRHEFPISIVRPSVVITAIKDPFPNYAEGLNGFFGTGIATQRGVMRTALVEKNSYAQIIPVDTVANTIITTSWIHGTKMRDQLEYYNVNNIAENTLKFEVYINVVLQAKFKYPLNYSLLSPNLRVTTCVYYYYLRTFFYQLLPSALVDILIWISGRQPILIKIQRKICYSLNLVTPYLRQFTFTTDNFLNIRNYLNQVDRDIFNTDVTKLSPYEIIESAHGIRKFLAKETDDDLPRARKIVLIWYWVDLIVQCVVVFYVIQILFHRYFSI